MRKRCFPQPCKNNQKDKVDEESAGQLVLRDLQLERRTNPRVALASTLSVLQVSDRMFWNAALQDKNTKQSELCPLSYHRTALRHLAQKFWGFLG